MLSRLDIFGIQDFGESTWNKICDISEYNGKEIDSFLVKIASGKNLKDLKSILNNVLKQDLELGVKLTPEDASRNFDGMEVTSTKDLLENQSIAKLALKNLQVQGSTVLLPEYEEIDFKDVKGFNHQIHQLSLVSCCIKFDFYWEDHTGNSGKTTFGYAVFNEREDKWSWKYVAEYKKYYAD